MLDRRDASFQHQDATHLRGAWHFKWLHRLFHHRALCAADGFDLFHPLLDRRLREKGALLEFLQDAGPFILLLETTDGAVDWFILANDNSDQCNHLLDKDGVQRLNWRWDTLNNFRFL